MDQLILAVRKNGLSDELSKTGFHPASNEVIISKLNEAGLWLGPRSHLESDESFRQIIPYIIIQQDDRIVCCRRSKAGAENRLHGRLSIGFGGHVDIVDVVCVDEYLDLNATLLKASGRELSEELSPINILARRWIGLLAENESSVGRVHIGVVGMWTIGPGIIVEAEEAVRDVHLIRPEEACDLLGEFEAWSAFLLPNI